MDPARPTLIPHSLHILASDTWSPVSERPHLLQPAEPCTSLSVMLGGLHRAMGGGETS